MNDRVKGIVVLEGSDGTGKTTLAKRLCEIFDGHYMHLTYRWPCHMFEYQLAAAHRAVKLSQTRLVVVDRHWVSDAIYDIVFRKSYIRPEMGRMFDRIFKRFGTVYITCVRDSQTYKDAFAKLKSDRVEMYDDNDKMKDINDRYIDFFFGRSTRKDEPGYVSLLSHTEGFKLHQNSLSYDINVEGKVLDKFCEYVVDRVKEARSRLPPMSLDTTHYNLLGDVSTAEVVFVNTKNKFKRRQVNYPAMIHQGSSLFMARCLTELGVDEKNLCYVNKDEKHGEAILSRLVHDHRIHPIYLGGESYYSGKYGAIVYNPEYAMRLGLKDEFKNQLFKALCL